MRLPLVIVRLPSILLMRQLLSFGFKIFHNWRVNGQKVTF